uniref:Endonuclease/exonuclease/phosphatase domain-containing protein n=1 Tax=Latimeria chalumnae TaxID=7897 RepID=H2ZRY8_LATCH
FVTWNVQTLLDDPNSDRPERRTAIVAQELSRYNIDIAALSETRCADEGHLREEGSGYTFFWKGKPANDRRVHGVGFAIKNQIVSQMTEFPAGINECLMTLRLQLANNSSATVISTYAPTLAAEEEQKEQFYADLDEILTIILKEDKIILLGDFNARVGRDSNMWRGTIGKEGVGKANPNSILLLSKCVEHDLVITNTIFRQRDRYKTTWQHPHLKQWHLLDYVIVRARDLKDVHITRVMREADDCWTNHRLVRSILSIRIALKHRKQPKTVQRQYNIKSLAT